MANLALIPYGIASILISTAVPLILNPVSFSAPFIKLESAQSAFYVRQLGVRHLTLAVTMAVLTYRGLLSGAATLLCCFSIIGALDPCIGYAYRGHFVKNDLIHFVVPFCFGGAGWWILKNL